jgi:hypothetical protein
MARAVMIFKNRYDDAEQTVIAGPYESAGKAQDMIRRIAAANSSFDLVDSWVEVPSEPVVWAKVDTDPTL